MIRCVYLAAAMLGLFVEVSTADLARTPPQASIKESPDWDSANNWIEAHLGDQGAPPISFRYGGARSVDFLPQWKRSCESESLDENRLRRQVVYRDPETKLEVRCEATVYKDLPAVDWVVKVKNGGTSDAPLLADLCAIDVALPCGRTTSTVHYAKGVQEGVDAQLDDFAPRSSRLDLNDEFEVAPKHGRSSWGDSLPFFNLEFVGAERPDRGVVLAVGWTGQWFVHMRRNASHVAVRAGMENVSLVLHPGEEIRSPKIMLLFWQVDRQYGQNLLRRQILRRYHPQRDGKPLPMPFLASSAGLYHEAMEATDENQREYGDALAKLGIEYLWLDVGWHVMNPSSHIGPTDATRFPKGLRSLSDYLQPKGIGVLAWFAPEFQGGASWMEREHPELFLRLKDPAVRDLGHFAILNFGDARALKLVSQYMAEFLQKEGIGIYRQDGPIGANLETTPGRPYPDKQPLRWWRDADPSERRGITEIRYVEGLYAFWDELLRQNPKLIIDHCGGGATRIDIEAMSRGVYLWRSDYNHPGFDPTTHQVHTYGLSAWVPSTGTASGYPETYSFRSSIGNGIALCWNPFQPKIQQTWPLAFPVSVKAPYRLTRAPRTTVDGVVREGYVVDEPFPWQVAERLAAEFKGVRRFFYGDFYPLTPYNTAEDSWMAYQFHDEGANEGIALAFRRANAEAAHVTVNLWGLDAEAKYEVTFTDARRSVTRFGRDLASGLEVAVVGRPGSELVTYRKAP